MPSEVLKIAQKSKCLSDEAFASKVRYGMLHLNRKNTANFCFFDRNAFTLDVKQCDAKQPKFDINDNLRKVSTGRKLRERFLTSLRQNS